MAELNWNILEDNPASTVDTVNTRIKKRGGQPLAVSGKLKKAKDAESALEEIQSERFYNTLKSYYSYRENDNSFFDKSHADLLEYFYTDRSWRNNNTVSMSMDMANVIGEEDNNRLKEFAYIQQTYNMLPSFWDDPNRSFGSWLVDNGGAMLADPVNLIGVGVGGQAAKQTYKQVLKEALKGKVAKEITEQSVLIAAKEAEKKALGQAVKKGALYEGAIGAGVTTAQDAMLQTTAIQTGVQDEFSLKQSVIAGAAGFGFGTLFGAGFSYGGFKLTNRNLKNQSVRQLLDLQNYGRDDITGRRLFDDLTVKKDKKNYYQNLSKEQIDSIEARSKLTGETTDARIRNLRETADAGISPTDKPPKTPFNYTRYKRGDALIYFKNQANEMSEIIGSEKYTFKEIEELAEKLYGANPKKLRKLAKSKSKEDRNVPSLLLAHANSMIKESEDIVKLSNELNRVDLKPKEKELIIKELELRNDVLNELMDVQKSLQQIYATATASGRIVKDQQKAISLKLDPEDIKMKELKQGDPEAFWKTVSMLDDDNQVILALQNARKVNKWDIAAEYVNNNLLSSPDTHILNIISGLTQTQWKPFVMLLRAGNIAFKDRHRAKIVAREALQTYVYQYAYIGHALKRALKSFYYGRPILDSRQMKYDSNIRQGQMQRFINETGKLLTEPLGMIGTPIQKGIIEPASYITSLPMRVLSAGDEFLKTMMFKARTAAQINSRIIDETPDIGIFKNRLEYKKRFRELEKDYQTDGGAGLEKDGSLDQMVNDPLQYAREGSYTQSAYSTNPLTGKNEGKVTGTILSIANQHKWLRVAGLHFVNTPSNLLRWNFQHLPFIGRYQFQMRHMLAKGKDGKYLNPEAAAEAKARIQAGWLLWGTAIFAAIKGDVTGGGSRDWKENRERTKTTGWQEYSIKTKDGRYISVNRLDPIMMPFMIAADFVDAFGDFFKHNEDLPEEVENQYIELAMGVVASLTRNLTSKFYTKNILETANFFFSDDFMKSRAPDRIGSSIIARAIYKITPLSGGLRYGSRVSDEQQRELFTFNDRLRQLNPFSDKDRTMPQRNMFGEKIDRKNGWLFGLGGKTGLWSSPFAMTNFKNNETTKFFANRELDYKAPQKVDRYTNIDLRTIRNDDGQTAYDRMLELKGEVDVPYKGKKYKLKDLIEVLVADKTSALYRLPEGIVAGDDYRQKYILDIVHAVEREAFNEMWKEFPILEETLEKRDLFIKEKAKTALSEFMKAVE
ncbi:internal virion protein D [Pelagibacter phage HTVC168P]|nr:internal virion protein D [Pelagibacter phage HTVC168P]